MTVDEVFTVLASHMIKGMMVHEQLMNTYLFLGLNGYAKCHEYHYISETKGYIRLSNYKLEHYGSLIKQGPFEIPEIIPESWFGFTRSAVDSETRHKAMVAALEEWIKWERQTRELYVVAFEELMQQNQVATAEFVKSYILDVEDELVYATNEKIHKSSMGYDIVSVVEEQDELSRFFDKKIHKS